MTNIAQFSGKKKPSGLPALIGAHAPVSDFDGVATVLAGLPGGMMASLNTRFVAHFHHEADCSDCWVRCDTVNVETVRISGMSLAHLEQLRRDFKTFCGDVGREPYLAMLWPLAWAITRRAASGAK